MKSLIRYLSIFYINLILLSCGKNTTNDRDKQVFRFNQDANVSSLDPAFAKSQDNIWMCNQIFNGLVQLDDSLNVKPDLAKSWTISDDGKTYTFLLRNDVFFHQIFVFEKKSRTVKAQDFEFSFNRILDEKVASPGGWIMQNVESFSAENDSVFKINLKKSFPAFLGLLSMKYASVVPKEAFVSGHDFRTNPIGTGPFQYKLWEENVKLVLRRNPLYFEKDESGNQLPYLEAVAVTFLPDKQSGFLQFAQGKIDFVSGLHPSYKDEILTQSGKLQSKYEEDVNMITGSYLNTEYLGFRMDGEKNPAKDKRIRQALNYGFDRKKLVTYLRNGMGTPAVNGIIPAGLPGFDESKIYYDFDSAKAKKLVAEYKKETGDNNPKIALSTNATYLDIAEYLQREWKKIGLDVSIDVNPPATLRQAISTGKFSFFRASWIADYPDAENYLSLFYSKNFAPNGPNYTHFFNPEFDRLYEQAFLETNDTKRILLYQKMDALVMEESPIIPLFYDKVARFTRKNITGLGINPLNMLDLRRVKKLDN
ncbi:ABC transporter substrate-binding protein [Flavobacterium sp. NST-5]|uniref:ABC transporter substrate-binding protein n=1 Tax=Flavobacterium ichthyis TaxID=2698827 RepID=A0ABW9ZFH4_9FLAO|nr:ABC transporter substrate-binding protein [Flavobacterium ichthyis]NBL66012.1 ABC transporter substrate-binding protein [Flavobacterium ichthyis]